MAPRDWPSVVEGFTRVQKIVHLANRMQPEREASAIQTELFKQKRLAYEDELTSQAAAIGCAGRTGTASPATLAGMMEEARTEALGIINTYNYDMALAIRNIASEVPTANRNVYAKRLGDWEAVRNEWKSKQIMLWNTVNWQDRAQKEFIANNPNLMEGRVIVEPQSTAVCDICVEAVNKGEMSIEEANRYIWPAHLNCPHHNVIKYRTKKVDCSKLWVGTTLEDWFQEIGKELGKKGGAGSGNWGHSGRPGLRGGSAPYKTAMMAFDAGISDEMRKAVSKAYFQLPRKVRDLVGQVVVTDEEGYEFEAGGKQYKAGASWNLNQERITIYGSHPTGTVASTMAHEAGHAIFDNWHHTAVQQGNELAHMPPNPDPQRAQITLGALLMDGRIDPQYPDINPNNYTAYSADLTWSFARQQGEDGVTSYSKAWNNSTETFAELYAYSYIQRGSGSSPGASFALARSLAKNEGAARLGEAFEQVARLYED